MTRSGLSRAVVKWPARYAVARLGVVPIGATILVAVLVSGASAMAPRGDVPAGWPSAQSGESAAPHSLGAFSAPDALDLEMIGRFGGAVGSIAANGRHAYVVVGLRIEVLDVSDPEHPEALGRSPVLPGNVRDLEARGDMVYATLGSAGVALLDVSDGRAPRVRSTLRTPGRALGIDIAGSFAFVAARDAGLVAVNIADPDTPYVAGWVQTPVFISRVHLHGDHAYLVGSGCRLLVVDVLQPSSMRISGELALPTRECSGLDAAHDHAFLAAGNNGLLVVDVSDKASPRLAGAYTNQVDFGISKLELLRPNNVAVSEGYALVSGTSVAVLDIAEPTVPRLVGHLPVSGFRPGVAVADGHALITIDPDIVKVFDVTQPVAIHPVGFLRPPQEPYHGDIWPDNGNILSMADGFTFLAGGAEQGLWVVDVRDRTQPKLVHHAPEMQHEKLAADGSTVFAAGKESGIDVLDVSDPSRPQHVGHAGFEGLPFDLAASGTQLYVTDLDHFLTVFDASDPSTITRTDVPVAFFPSLSSLAVDGQIGCVAARGSTSPQLVRFDLSDPAGTSHNSYIPIERYPCDLAIQDGRAYVVDETELSIYDVSVPDYPPLKLGGHPATCGLLRVSGDRAYVVNERIEAYDVGDPRAVGHLGTHEPLIAEPVIDMVVSGATAVALGRFGFHTLDVSAASGGIEERGRHDFAPGYVNEVELDGDVLYAANGQLNSDGRLRSFDVSDPATPIEMDAIEAKGHLHVRNGYAILTGSVCPNEWEGWDPLGLCIVDVRNPSAMSYAGSAEFRARLSDLYRYGTPSTVDGTTAYVAGVDHHYLLMTMVDVGNPAAPTVVGEFWAENAELGDYPGVGIAARDGYVYLAMDAGWLRIVDARDPHDPVEVGALQTSGGPALGIALRGDIAYMAMGDAFIDGYRQVLGRGLRVIDVSDASDPRLLATVPTQSWPNEIRAVGDRVYITDTADGVEVFDVSVPSWPRSLVNRTKPSLSWDGYFGDADLAVGGDLLYLASGYDGVAVLRAKSATDLTWLHMPTALTRAAVAGR